MEKPGEVRGVVEECIAQCLENVCVDEMNFRGALNMLRKGGNIAKKKETAD